MANKKFIGPKQVESYVVSEEKTAAGNEIITVTYKDGKVEHFSKTMFDNIISPTVSDLSQLRDKRVKPIVEMVLSIMREYGVKVGELQYFASMLNSSLDFNTDQALLKLVGQHMPEPLSLDDVDLITVDRILKKLDTKV